MIKPYFEIGPFKVHIYGLIVATAVYGGYLLAKKRAKFYKIPSKLFDDPILVLPLILAIVFARLYHVIDYAAFYLQNPIKIIEITNGGLGIWGGLCGAVLGFYLISKVKKINLIKILDLTAPSFLLGQAIGRIGNWVNQEAFGPPTSLPWKIFIDSDKRPTKFLEFSYFHPTFFYEALLDIFFFFILIVASSKMKKSGQTFGLYLVLYGIGRFSVEFFRFDTWEVWGIKIAHVLSLLAVVVGLYFLLNNSRQRNSKHFDR